MPRALIEALSKAVPSIGSDVGGIPELLEKEYLIPINRNRVDALCDLLTSFDRNTLKTQAIKSYNEARKYDKKKLNDLRKGFFELFQKSINN